MAGNPETYTGEEETGGSLLNILGVELVFPDPYLPSNSKPPGMRTPEDYPPVEFV
jgi:hypothetical protein